jgi:hypothetical protein
MDTLRKPFLWLALVLVLAAVLLEIGGLALLQGPASSAASLAALLPAEGEVREAYDDLDPAQVQKILTQKKPPGLAIPALALLNGILLFTVSLMTVSLLISQRLHARLQGVATLIFALIMLLAAIALLFQSLIKTLAMITLFLAAPFGTLAYLAIYGFFNTGGASLVLGLLMTLNLAFVIALLVAQQRFLQNKGLVMMILTTLVAIIIANFLHGFVPGFLVSISDGIAAIIVAILAFIWALVLLISAIVAVVKALRVDRA